MAYQLVGVIRNSSRRTYREIHVKVEFYDEQGNLLNCESGAILDLQPGEISDFHVFVWNDRARVFKVTEIDGRRYWFR